MSNTSLLAGWRERWNKSLFLFLRQRVRGAVDIEDLAQETYLRLLLARDLSGVRNPQAYLLQVARHVVLEWRGQRIPPASFVDLEEASLVDECPPELELEARTSQERLELALEEVSPVVRAVLLLRLRDERPCREIAAQLGLTERQVKRHLARGYDHLRTRLES
ncbi:MAG: sigma-70 family RNA polymerase sigma factor [Proteobacteria bacterium]|nr:sigma-70 family RNA polymerase sigma factor [Pseudomonadota bacterium]